LDYGYDYIYRTLLVTDEVSTFRLTNGHVSTGKCDSHIILLSIERTVLDKSVSKL